MVATAQVIGNVAPPAPLTPARLRELNEPNPGLPAATSPRLPIPRPVPGGAASPGRKPERRKSSLEDADLGAPLAAATAGDDAERARPSGPAPAGAPSPDAYAGGRSRRRSLQQGPTNASSEVLMASEIARRQSHADLAYTASEIYEPDWSLSPFPSTVVGTYSCHGIEPSFFTAAAMAKINQDRGIVVQPFAPGAGSRETGRDEGSRNIKTVSLSVGTVGRRGARSSRSSTATASTATRCRSSA